MNFSEKFGFNLPSRDGDDIADINLISENFQKIDQSALSIEDKTSLANAIVVTVKGKAVTLCDVSPIEHNVKVKVAPEEAYYIAPYLYSDLSCETPVTEWVDSGDGTGEDVPVESSGHFIINDINKFIDAATSIGIDFSSDKHFVLECDFSSDREVAIYNILYLNGTEIARDAHSTFVEEWGVDLEYTISIASVVYAGFTVPSSDMSAVKLSASVSNIFEPQLLGGWQCQANIAEDGFITLTATATQGVAYYKVGRITLKKGLTYYCRAVNAVNVGNLLFWLKNTTSTVWNAATNPTFTPAEDTEVELAVYAKNIAVGEASSYIQIGYGDCDYVPYQEPITYPVNADGTVEGVTSIYPNMSLVTDAEDVVIDVTYNADTKKYIDNKFAKLAAMIVNS